MTMRHYRQSVLDGHPVFVLITIAVILYVFAGGVVYWLVTGSSTIGVGGRMTPLGEVMWVGPIFAWLLVYAIGRRGPFAPLWQQPATVSVDDQTLAWSISGQIGSAPWDTIASIRPRIWDWEWTRGATYASIESTDGIIVAVLPLLISEVTGTWRRRQTTLVDLAVARRPDRFKVVGRMFRRRAVVR